jgi:predicted transcriptional regulator
MSGDPLVMDGLEPEAILEGLADIEAGRMVPLVQIIAERK